MDFEVTCESSEEKLKTLFLFQRCRFIERLLPLCSSAQLDMLWTVLQPSLHREYFYAVQSRYPNYHFKRISTPDSRILKVWNLEKQVFVLYEFLCIQKINRNIIIHVWIEKKAFILVRLMIFKNFVMMMVWQKYHNHHLHSKFS